MEIRELKNNEDLYIYKNSMQISQQTGLIGHLRGDFGNNGNEFWTTWWDFRKDRKTEEFKSELDAVINILRKDDNILFNLDSMKAFCRDKRLRINPYGDNRSYGIRVDTEMYAYLIKLTPYPDDYNFYCYCYIKDYLDSHIEKASGGIRFIDSCYNDKFIRSDGSKIKLIYSDGREQEKICRYIDSCHVEVGSELYHICEFAERTERAGITIVPISEEDKTKIFTGDIAIGPCNAKVFFYYDKAEFQYKAKSMDSDKSFELRSDLGQMFEVVGNIFDEEDKDGTR